MHDLINLRREITNLKKEKEYKTEKLKLEKELENLRKENKPKNQTIEKIKTNFGKVAKDFGNIQKDYLGRKEGIFG